MLQYFGLSYIFTIICFGLSYRIGGREALFITCMLAVLEISLSFDNAILNARELEHMDEVWKKRFLTRGILIAVFGMRIIFPLLIVSIVGDMNMRQSLQLALGNPDQYQIIIQQSHIALSAFGGSFLMMVFLKFFLDKEKDIHWIHLIEQKLSRLGKLESIEVIAALLMLILISILPGFPEEKIGVFLGAGICGIITYLAVGIITQLLQEHEKSRLSEGVIKTGLASFLYLEVLDASFSFDGVIGAFALTKNILIIALGLGIGAMFVRSLTVVLTEKKTLKNYTYLEHGAFWAIGGLSTIMLISTIYHIPEIITGLISGVLILASLIHSIFLNKKH